MSWAVERQTGRGNDERIVRCIPASYGIRLVLNSRSGLVYRYKQLKSLYKTMRLPCDSFLFVKSPRHPRTTKANVGLSVPQPTKTYGRRAGRRIARTFALTVSPQNNVSPPFDSRPDTPTPGGISSRSRTFAV